MNIDKQLNEYTKIVECKKCIPEANNVILRDDDNIPQPGYIGARYEQYRVCFIVQNPGYAKRNETKEHREHAKAEDAFLNDPTQDNMVKLQIALKQVMPKWTIFKRDLKQLLTLCSLSLEDDIAYFNVVRCPTKNNKTPSSKMISNCNHHFEHWLDWLEPRVLVPLGKPALDQLKKILHFVEQRPDKITNAIGKSFRAKTKSGATVIVVPTLHPANSHFFPKEREKIPLVAECIKEAIQANAVGA